MSNEEQPCAAYTTPAEEAAFHLRQYYEMRDRAEQAEQRAEAAECRLHDVLHPVRSEAAKITSNDIYKLKPRDFQNAAVTDDIAATLEHYEQAALAAALPAGPSETEDWQKVADTLLFVAVAPYGGPRSTEYRCKLCNGRSNSERGPFPHESHCPAVTVPARLAAQPKAPSPSEPGERSGE